MTKSANITAIETATKRSWEGWVTYLESIGAKQLSHKEIAQTAHQALTDNQASRGWWAQSIAVAYEQHIGRRAPGQHNDGTYEVSVTKTIPGTMDHVLEAWLQFVKGKTTLSDIAITTQPLVSATDKWRHWRCKLADDTRVSADIYQKTAKKAALSITHTKLQTPEAAEHWRAYWKNILDSFKQH